MEAADKLRKMEKQRKRYRAIREPKTPEECSTEMEILLVTLRKHQKNKEKILDPIFYNRAKMYFDYFNFDNRDPEDEEYNKLLQELKDVSEKIIKNKPNIAQLYIVLFEGMLKVTPLAKVCQECGCHFHPLDINRTTCIYCM